MTINAQKPASPAVSAAAADPAVAAIDNFLDKHEIDNPQRDRIASAIVASGRKYDLDPRLIASVVIVESRANPFAISESDSVGMMQIHLKTWGTTADKEDVNLFKIEDNIDFGSRILKEYSGRFGGIWEGVKRYKGWNPENPESAENVQAYIDKVRGIYSGDTLVSGN
jgi:soluble lytic murein transglycosylase-like protein